jgi:hypothetical protein
MSGCSVSTGISHHRHFADGIQRGFPFISGCVSLLLIQYEKRQPPGCPDCDAVTKITR